MAILTISTPGDLDNLLLPKHESCYCLDRVHIIIINISDACLKNLELSHGKIVQKIRNQEHLTSIPLIFTQNSDHTLAVGEVYADVFG